MLEYEGEFRFFNTVHQRVFKPKLITCREDFYAAFLTVFSQLGWFRQELLPVDTQHDSGIGLSAQLDGVTLLARTDPKSLSLAVTAIDYSQIANWEQLPETLQHNFPAQKYKIISHSRLIVPT